MLISDLKWQPGVLDSDPAEWAECLACHNHVVVLVRMKPRSEGLTTTPETFFHRMFERRVECLSCGQVYDPDPGIFG